MPPGLYCCRAPKGFSEDQALVLFVIPVAHDFASPDDSGAMSLSPASAGNVDCLLLRFLHELCSVRICLFTCASLSRFRPQLFPFDPSLQDDLMPVYDMQLQQPDQASAQDTGRVLGLSGGFSVAWPPWPGGGGQQPPLAMRVVGGELPCVVGLGEDVGEPAVEKVTRALSSQQFSEWVQALPTRYPGRLDLNLRNRR